jgi:hypothetical protein
VWEGWKAGFLAFHAFHTLSFPWPALETRFTKSQSPRRPVLGTGTTCPRWRLYDQVPISKWATLRPCGSRSIVGECASSPWCKQRIPDMFWCEPGSRFDKQDRARSRDCACARPLPALTPHEGCEQEQKQTLSPVVLLPRSAGAQQSGASSLC